MKFICPATKYSCRLGKITEVQRLPELTLETPMFMLHSKSGSVPHITQEVLEMIFQRPCGIQVPVSSTILNESAVRDFKKGIAEFIGLKENLIYCTVQDSAVKMASGFNDSNTVSVFTRKGRQQLDPESYMDIIEAFSPDLYQVLHDGDTDAESKKKRIRNSVDRTSRFTTVCLGRHDKSQVLRHKGVLGVIEGGYDCIARESCTKEQRNYPFIGFVIDGLHKFGPETESISFGSVQQIIQKTLDCLPPDKMRVIHGCWNPEVVLDMIELGIDVFDGSYPYIVTERGSALTFCNTFFRNCDKSSNKPNQEESDDTLKHSTPRGFEINLKDKKYFSDFQPISDSCSCLTCQEHTRSYIHHLLSVNELLGTVLLMIHNLHHYSEFFETIRTTIKENSWEDFRKNFNGQ